MRAAVTLRSTSSAAAKFAGALGALSDAQKEQLQDAISRNRRIDMRRRSSALSTKLDYAGRAASHV